MKGPSEDQVPYGNDAFYNQNAYAYSAQYYPPYAANLNGNNSGYQYQGHQGGFESSRSYHHGAEPSPASAEDSNPFAEYVWMADSEEFEKQVWEQMEQEEYLEACFQQLWDEEEDEFCIPAQGDSATCQAEANGLNRLTLNESQAPTMLNPNAAEFVPRWAIAHRQ